MSSDFTRIKNLQNFGKSSTTNLLILTGISGSGKTTTARRMADHYGNVDIIHLDAYFGLMPESCHLKTFDKFLEHSSLYDGFYDEFPEAILSDALFYAAQIFPTKRVIAEGAHWLDPIVENSNPNIWESVKRNNMSIVVCETTLTTACSRSTNSDKVDRYWQRVWRSAIPRLLAD